MPFPTLGQIAPDFNTQDETGAPLSLSAHRGQRIVLYFYPKADTPGCVKQACAIRDNYQLFRTHDVTVIGVSPDTAEDQAAFKAKYNLPFTLAADADHAICELYGLWGEHKTVFNGVEYTNTGARRSTFIIEADGTVSYAKFGVSATENPGEILDFLDGKPQA